MLSSTAFTAKPRRGFSRFHTGNVFFDPVFFEIFGIAHFVLGRTRQGTLRHGRIGGCRKCSWVIEVSGFVVVTANSVKLFTLFQAASLGRSFEAVRIQFSSFWVAVVFVGPFDVAAIVNIFRRNFVFLGTGQLCGGGFFGRSPTAGTIAVLVALFGAFGAGFGVTGLFLFRIRRLRSLPLRALFHLGRAFVI